ncbi:nucleotide-diphospho-sugar transferase [Auriculariales sp. MPI-PUGE-AT-0066]|nr:nucleotide-diphospho-sugar transferase [Auriculariales sp. MPI-PUGE-AT-0066]
MARRRTCSLFLSLLALFLFGTVIVLSTVSFYLAIDPKAYLSEAEVHRAAQQLNTSDARPERIPRILHQTWRTEDLGERWGPISQRCREMMPDYEYMLWTDEKSRDFIATNYGWFLPTFDAYRYPIQRADSIRYFILYHYGGIYLDLDIGCIKRLDPLLVHPVILPRTIPVGVSNDLMFAEKHHPFMEQTIQNLINFDHTYVLNYPTVMFTTGPMFVSAQYGLYTSAHPGTPGTPGEVRILPKSLYGKNAKEGEAPNSFFEHYYGSSWHADDAMFITFLGRWGRNLMWIGAAVVIIGSVRAFFLRRHSQQWRRHLALVVPYPVFPTRPGHRQRAGSIRLDLSNFPPSETTSEDSTPTCSEPSTPSAESRIPLLPVFEVRPPSPSAASSSSFETLDMATAAPARSLALFNRAGRWAWEFMGVDSYFRHSRSRSTSGRRRRNMTFYLPAFFEQSAAPARDTESMPADNDKRNGMSSSTSLHPAPPPYAPPQTEWSPVRQVASRSSSPVPR